MTLALFISVGSVFCCSAAVFSVLLGPFYLVVSACAQLSGCFLSGEVARADTTTARGEGEGDVMSLQERINRFCFDAVMLTAFLSAMVVVIAAELVWTPLVLSLIPCQRLLGASWPTGSQFLYQSGIPVLKVLEFFDYWFSLY